MAHVFAKEAEELVDEEIKVLDKGFVRLVDYLGGDARIVQAARVSYGRGTKTVREDAALIDYLLRNRHTSPFEQVVLTFHVKTPIFVARQWVRHRTARMNEISGRYSVMADEFYVPDPHDVRQQNKTNKQGRSDEPMSGQAQAEFIETLKEDQSALYARYEAYVGQDIAREIARINLPLSLYTQFYWQIDLHNLFHFLRLRLDSHAQSEIRAYAQALSACAKAVAPLAYAAFEEHLLGVAHFSRSQLLEIREAFKSGAAPLDFLSADLRQKLIAD